MPWRGKKLQHVAVVLHPRLRALQAPSSCRAPFVDSLFLTSAVSTFFVPDVGFLNVRHPRCNGGQQVATGPRAANPESAARPGSGAQMPLGLLSYRFFQTSDSRRAQCTAFCRLPHVNVFRQLPFPGRASAHRTAVFPDNVGREPGAAREPTYRPC